MSIGGVAIDGGYWYVYVSSHVVRGGVRMEVGFIWNMTHVLRGHKEMAFTSYTVRGAPVLIKGASSFQVT